MKRWLWNFAVVLDLAFNTLILCSRETETLSRRAAKARLKNRRWACILCGLLDRINRDHCTKALTGP